MKRQKSFSELRRRLISSLCAIAIAFTMVIVPGKEGEVQAATIGKTQADAVNWCKQQIGASPRDYDGAAGVQCVDLVRMYTAWLGYDIGRCKIEGYASDYASQTLDNASYYTRYDNSVTPQPGDIFVWGKGAYGASKTTGHVGIIYEVGSNYYKYIDFIPAKNGNAARGALGTTQKDGVKNFTKIIRPNFTNPNPAPRPSGNSTVVDGTYMLKNVGSGYAMNYAYGTNAKKVWMSKYGDEETNEQHFKFVHEGGGKYKIEAVHDGNVVNCECGLPVTAGVKITVRKYTANDTQRFYVTPVGNNTYLIQSASDPNLVLAAPSGDFHAQLEIQYYSGGNLQLWSFDPNANPTPTPTNTPTATPTPTNTPTPTATPTPTKKPATPTPTKKPATPTPTKKPATPTPTKKPATPTPTKKPAAPTPTTPVMPKSVWVQDGSNRYYYDNNGTKVTGWKQIDGDWYFFNGSGVMMTGWQKSGSAWYYLDASGIMKTGWLQSGKTWYYLSSSGAMVTGWQNIGGKWYYFGSSGAMATGWIKLGGTWYYLGTSGAMVTGWVKIGGTWYYMADSGAMTTGWKQIRGKWYWFDQNGAMAASTGITIKGKTYYFDSDGMCLNP